MSAPIAARRFIVTGGAGFIGSAVVRRLIRETSHQVLVVDKLTYAGSLDSLASVANDIRFRFEQADVADAARMRAMFEKFEPDVVMHLAAETHVDRSIDAPGDFVQSNVVGAYVLLQAALRYWRSLDAARRARFRFHHVSTDEVFGSLGEDGLSDEDASYRPNSPYSASKAAADHFVRAWRQTYGLPTVLTNCSNNYGPYHFPEKLIPLTIINGLEGKPMPVYGTGRQVRDWLFVEDHAEALLLVAEQGRIGESYNVGARCERRNIDVVRAICRLIDEMAPDAAIGAREGLIRFVEDRPGHDLRYALDARKIERDLGWRPRETFDSGLRKTVRWFLDNRGWWERARAGIYGGERLGRVV